MQEATTLKTKYEAAERGIHAESERIMILGGVIVDRSRVLAARKRKEEAAGALRKAIEAVQEMGCLIKDLDTGLIDFPTLFRGREVYLCWKLGEPDIGFWHGVEEGFAGRKAIDQDFLDHHQGDFAQ
jgi:hypothetical protein